MKKKATKVVNVIVDILIILVLLVSVFTLVSVLTTTNGGKGVPNIFGKAPIGVLTDSMKGDKPDSFNQGDLIICDVVDSNANNTFKEGDVITFRADIDNDGKEDLLTHRIYKVNEDGSFQTKGDANISYDQDPSNATRFANVFPRDVLAVYHGAKISGLGNVINFIRTPMGFFLIILLPMIIFFIYQAIRVIMNAMAYSREKGKLAAEEAIANSGLTEEQKAKAIAEYLEQQKQRQEKEFAEPSPDGEAKDE